MAAAGASAQPDVSVDNTASVGHIQSMLHRTELRLDNMEYEIANNVNLAEQQLAAFLVDVRTLQMAPPTAAQDAKRYDFIDTKTMSPSMIGGTYT